MLLYSLPNAYENFRCAIELRDYLLKPEALEIKILEENDARLNKSREDASNAFWIGKSDYEYLNTSREVTYNQNKGTRSSYYTKAVQTERFYMLALR